MVSTNNKRKENVCKEKCKILSSLDGDLVHSIHLLHGELEKKMDMVLAKKEGLTLSQYIVLVGLFSDEKPLSQAKLAEKLRLTEATISRHIGILVDKKVLIRSKEEGNKKSYTLSLSTLGVTTFKKTEATLLKTIEEILSPFTKKEKDEVRVFIKKIIDVLQK